MSKIEAFLAKLENNNNRTFFLPVLQEEITYKKMDVIEASVNNSLPNFLASRVLDAMKKTIGGDAVEDLKIQMKDEDIRDLLVKATEMWSKLVIDPKLSDAQIVEIPSEDRLAWFLNAVAESQKAETKGGGVIDADEVATFPDETGNKRNSKRTTNS